MFIEEKAVGEKQALDAASVRLLAAAEYIERVGHCKRVAVDSVGRRCTLGALYMGQFNRKNADALEAEKRLSIRIGQPIASWNDAPERTAAEVVATLRSVALGG